MTRIVFCAQMCIDLKRIQYGICVKITISLDEWGKKKRESYIFIEIHRLFRVTRRILSLLIYTISSRDS